MTLSEVYIPFAILLLCIFAHEFGHWLPAKLTGARPKFGWYNSKLIMRSHPRTDAIGLIITLGGIFAGFVPIVIFYDYLNWYGALAFGAFMLAGCRGTDFEQLKAFYNKHVVRQQAGV